MSSVKLGFIINGKEYSHRDEYLKEVLSGLLDDTKFNKDNFGDKLVKFKKLLGGRWDMSDEELAHSIEVEALPPSHEGNPND